LKLVLMQSAAWLVIAGLTPAAFALGTDTTKGIPEGNWRSPCAQPDAPWGTTAREEIIVKNGVISTTTTYFADEKCQTPSVQSEWSAKQTAGKDVFPSGARPLDLTFLTAIYTPVTEDGAKALNTYQWCGATNWAVGKPQDVTSKSGADNCIGKLPSTNYTIFNVIGDKLFIGKSASTTPEGRAKELSPTFFYTKVQATEPGQPSQPGTSAPPAQPPGGLDQPTTEAPPSSMSPDSLTPQEGAPSIEFLNMLSTAK
jgi:hypothetical protein